MSHAELKKLQDLVSSLDPKNEEHAKSSVLADSLRTDLVSESDRVKEALAKTIFTQSRENIVERYIQFHQTGIIELADQLQSYIQHLRSPEVLVLVGFFIETLFDLLSYIERFFSKYFNLDARIPEPYRLITLKQLGIQISTVLNLTAEKPLTLSLRLCISTYLTAFKEDTFPENITFRSLIYLKSFLTELEQLLCLGEVKNWEDSLAETLIYLNFNRLAFLSYYQETIRTQLSAADSKDEQLTILSRYLTHVKSLQTKPAFSCHPDWPNIRTMFENWLSDELSMIVLQREKNYPDSISVQSKSTEKLEMNLSVAHMACLTRLFFEEDCYRNLSVTDIVKFTVRNFRSKRQEHISPGSFSKEYYDISQVTAAVVLDLLQKMVARLKKTHFP